MYVSKQFFVHCAVLVENCGQFFIIATKGNFRRRLLFTVEKKTKLNLWARNWEMVFTHSEQMWPFVWRVFGQLLLKTQFIIIFVVFCYNWREINRSIIARHFFFTHTKNGTQKASPGGEKDWKQNHSCCGKSKRFKVK